VEDLELLASVHLLIDLVEQAGPLLLELLGGVSVYDGVDVASLVSHCWPFLAVYLQVLVI
jgi:hypothetical protein